MVENKRRTALHFIVFLLPAFFLYTLFFIYPFFKGFSISLTNWDGLTPRAPITIDSGTFETAVMAKLDRQSDRDYLLSLYSKNEDGTSWSRLGVSGSQRRKIESILSRAGYEPESNRFVGLRNYRDILGGRLSDAFYPRSYTQSYFNATSALPMVLDDPNLEINFLSRLSAGEREVFDRYYRRGDKGFALINENAEFDLEDLIWLIPEIDETALIPENDASDFMDDVRAAGVSGDRAAFEGLLSGFLETHALTGESRDRVVEGATGLYELGDIKHLLSSKWKSEGFDLGVIGFTLFFTVFSVLGINLIAFLLALALDSGIRGQKVLRSIFFLPNVLSMVIVALIWKMLFFQLFPRLTGIDQWLSDPAKTPWLIVLVAVWQGAGYYMIVYLAGLQNIPTDVVEAATIDGANPWQRFRSITLPLLVPAITISFFLTLANALKSFDLIYAMTSGSAYTFGTVPVVLDIFFDAFARKRAGLATAKAMLLFVIIFVVTGIQLIIMKRKEVEQ